MDLEQFKSRLTGLTPAELKIMLERRHPDYASKLAHWNFLEATYEGGREWFEDNIFKYHKEGDTEFAERRDRAYRFNHTREVVDLVNKYIFKADIKRRNDDAPSVIKDFWKSATLRGRRIEEFMKLVSAKASIFGKVWVVVDSNKSNEGGTVAEDKELGNRVYAYVVKPQNVLDMAFAKDGTILWVLLREAIRDDANPWDTGGIATRYRLLTDKFWAVFTETTDTDGKKAYEFDSAGQHDVGMVPAFPVDHVIDEDQYSGQALIDDTAYLDRAVANYLSNLDAIIQDQTFSQLVIPAQAMLPGSDGEAKILEMGTKRVFTYDGQANIEPKFIAPDPRQANIILAVIEKIISEIYHSTGMAGERTKQDNSMGIDNSSGVAKAYDFEKMNAMLASKANALQQAEVTLMKIVSAFNSEEYSEEERPLVEYPKDFDVRGLYDEFDIAQRLALVAAPKTVRREQMKAMADKLFPTLKDALIAKMKSEIDKDWLEEPTEDALSVSGKPPVPASENKQGQNNKDDTETT